MASTATQAGTSAPYHSRRPERTPLYQVVQDWLTTDLELARQADWDGDAVPPYVEREFYRFLECGILAYGFARVYCDAWGHDFLVAFSCKGRGVCPSCMARRMAETAAHLVDHVFPALPVHQWVISFPKRLRDFLQRDPAVRSAVLRMVLRVIEQALQEPSPGAGPEAKGAAPIGAVAFIHHFGASLNEHTPFHIGVIDGVFAGAPDDSPIALFEATAMEASTVAAAQSTIRRRILRLFVRRGLLEAEDAKKPGSTTAVSPGTPRCTSRATTVRVWNGCSGTAPAHRSHWSASSGSTRSGSSTTCRSRPPTARLATRSRHWSSSAAWRR
jgi:hypothetical protein